MTSRIEQLDPRGWSRGGQAAVILVVFAGFYPFIVDYLQDIPLIGDFVPATRSMVVMLAFTMMAIGLNIVVGYAGLLDLGYVAFYAVGAYTAGWLASVQFEDITFHFGAIGVRSDFPGIHINMWLVLVIAGMTTLLAGVLIGLPTLRLGATTSRSSRSGSARSFRR